jgi:hypothetical protein
MVFEFTRPEIARLYEEIGDIPQSRVGPKLMELYKRFETILQIDWPKDNGTKKALK